MAHKFVPRKGFKKDKEQPVTEPNAAETPPPEGTIEEAAAPTPAASEPPPVDDDDAEVEVTPPKSFARGEARSAKDSILKKLPGKGIGPKSMPKLEPRKRPERRPSAPRGAFPTGYLAFISIGVFLVVGGVAVYLLSQVPGYHPGMAVTAPTRLDFTFVDNRRSDDKPDLSKLSDPTKERYDLYVPPDYSPDQGAAPLVLFLSDTSRPAGWSAWKEICVKNKVFFASPAGAGDDVAPAQRWKTTLDVLDEVRRKYKIDPDRTYIGGMWGGAREACHIAFTLPELFGGVVSVSGGGLMRDDPWLRYRVRERLSLAFVTTDKDRAEVYGLHSLLAKELKMRSEFWPIEGQAGRAMPSSDTLEKIFAWLEAGVKERQAITTKYPESRFPDEEPPNRHDWAKAYLAEARKRLNNPADFLSGLAQLLNASERWPDTQAGVEAKKLREEWKLKQQDRHWAEEEQKEQAAYDLLFARKLTKYLTSWDEIDQNEQNRIAWLGERRTDWENLAKARWQRISQLSPPGSEEKKEADKKLNEINVKNLFVPPIPAVSKK
jgi:pimeloyl-ACP methyl ester carboxylesterase